MKILFVGGGRTFEVFRQVLRGTKDENGEENRVRLANHDQAFRGVAGPIHIVYDEHYLAAGSLNLRERDNIDYANMRNEEVARGNSSRDDQDSGDRRGDIMAGLESARAGLEALKRRNLSDYGTENPTELDTYPKDLSSYEVAEDGKLRPPIEGP